MKYYRFKVKNKNHYLLVALVMGLILFGCQNQESKTTTSAEKEDTLKQDKIENSDKKGFVKKLFTSSTKEEKEAKAEAKIIAESKDRHTIVYGWHPYWIKSTLDSSYFNQLTTFSYFGIEANFDASHNSLIFDDHNFFSHDTQDMLDNASKTGCRIDITFVCQDSKAIDLLLNNQMRQDLCINYLLNILEANHKIDGVCVVLGNIPKGNSASLIKFISALKASLNKSSYTLKLGLPIKDSANNFDILKINSLIDDYVLMAFYNQQEGGSEDSVIPFEDSQNKDDLKSSVKAYLSEGVPFEKLIVALPYFDNDTTLERKYKWLVEQGVAGIGIWAIEYDIGTIDFMEMIEANFTVEKISASNPTIFR